MKFSANLGFLWADRPVAEGIRAAHAAGFDAVECHWLTDDAVPAIRAALDETGLPLLGLNTAPGDPSAGERGLAALPGRGAEARGLIDRAVDQAAALGARHVHVMAGQAQGPAAEDAFLSALDHATTRARAAGCGIVIEPLNRHDAPGYFLTRTGQAARLIDILGAPNLALMFDLYHVQREEGDLCTRFDALHPMIGHIQFAGVPDRGRPDQGELNVKHVLAHATRAGWSVPFGAEFRPGARTEASLDWMQHYRG